MNLAQEEAKEGIQQDIKALLETCPADKKDVSLCCQNQVSAVHKFAFSVLAYLVFAMKVFLLKWSP